MASKKESSLQVVAAVLGIIASVVALQDWYDRRMDDAPAHASAGVFRLHSPDQMSSTPAAEPVSGAASAAEAAVSAPPPKASVAATPVASPALAPATTPAAPAPAAPAATAGTPAAHARNNAVAAPAAAAAHPFMALVNAPAGARAGVAAAVRGEGAARLLSGLEQHGVNLLRDFFRGGFVQSTYFNQLLAGDGSALRQSGALAAGGRVLVGELQPSYQSAEMGLVVCDLSFNYVVLDAHGSRIARRSMSVSVPGDDRASALHDAIAMLLADHGATLARDAGG